MNKYIRNKIFFAYATATTVTILLIASVVFWKLHQNIGTQEIVLRSELADQAYINVRSYHYFTQFLLSESQRNLEIYTEGLLRDSPLASVLDHLQSEGIVNFLQKSGLKQQIDFALVFSADGALQASFGGQRAYRPGDLTLPAYIQNYPSFPFISDAFDILQKETILQISPEESQSLEQKLGMNSSILLKSEFLQKMGVEIHEDAVAIFSAGLIRDGFSLPVGVLIVGKLLNNLENVFGNLHNQTQIASSLFLGDTPISTTFAGFNRNRQGKSTDIRPEIQRDQALAVYGTGTTTDTSIFYAQEKYYAACSPVKDFQRNNIGILCTGLPGSLINMVQEPILTLGEELEQDLIQWAFSICFLMIFVFILLARYIAKGITKPLEELAHFTSEVDGTDISKRFNKLSQDEIGVLGQSINAMLDKLAAAQEEKETMENQLRQSHKLEAIGVLAGGIAHDFNNLLAIIMGYAELLEFPAEQDPTSVENVKNILVAANRAKELVRQILAFSRQAKVDRFPLDLTPLIKESLKMLRSSLPSTIEIRDNLAPHCGLVLADPTQVHQILMNLCTNAQHAMEDNGGILTIQIQRVLLEDQISEAQKHLQPGVYVELIISDTGTGIRPDLIDKVFDPYFTTKPQGKGTGMGLAIVHGLVHEYGGEITVESTLGKGTTFHVFLPVVEEAPVPDIEKPSQVVCGTARILFVDDEKLLAQMGKELLEPLGYKVTVREKSLEALSTFQDNPDAFDIVITDQTMPDMTGTTLAQKILEIRKDIPIILCTGFSSLVDEDSAKKLGIQELAYKPLTKEAISSLISKVLKA